MLYISITIRSQSPHNYLLPWSVRSSVPTGTFYPPHGVENGEQTKGWTVLQHLSQLSLCWFWRFSS
jgi:hypothetical protein